MEGSFCECPKFENTVNPLLSLPPPPRGGAHLFQALLKRAYNYNLAKWCAMYCFESNNLKRISIFHKELNLSGKTQANEVGLHAAEDQKQIRTSSA